MINGIHGDRSCCFLWITEHPGANGGERHGLIPVIRRKPQAVTIRLLQNLSLMAVATVPDGSNGMDHRFGREIARKRNYSMPRRALSLLLTHGFACFRS